MKTIIWYLAALSATAAFVVIRKAQSSRPVPVDELAHKLQDAWAKNHTVA